MTEKIGDLFFITLLGNLHPANNVRYDGVRKPTPFPVGSDS